MSSATQYISGLASGIDWRNMIDQLISIDQQSVTKLQSQISTMQSRKSAWQDLENRLSSLQTALKALRDEDAFNKYSTSLSSSSSTSAADLLSVTIGTSGSIGGFDVEIRQIATSEKLSSQSVSSQSDALGYSGEMLIGGSYIEIEATDTLLSIRNKINSLNSGDSPSGVSASILSTGEDSYRLVLTASETGEDGISIQSLSTNDIVSELGFTDGNTVIKNATSSGSQSDTFSSADTAVYSLLGMSAGHTGSVTIGTHAGITIDLSKSLTEIKDDINTAAGSNIASIVTETDDDGEIVYRLKLVGTNYTDNNNVLQALGVVEGTHDTVAEVVRSDAMQTTGAAAITAGTTFSQIDTGSGANNIANGDTITITGTDHDGNAVSSTFTITDTATTTIQDLLTEIETAFGSSVTASVDANGRITVTDDTTGESQLSLSLVANNDVGGGTLDFGEVSNYIQGRDMQMQAGQDARFIVDGVWQTSSSNTISDVVAGATLNLVKAEAGTTVSVAMERDKTEIRSSVNEFITAYNSVVSYMAAQSEYDEETGQTGGPLFGDTTMTGLRNNLMSQVISSVDGAAQTLSSLSLAGISLQDDGTLDMDSSTFNELIDSNFENLKRLFTISGLGSTGTIEYISSSRDTEAGTYELNITQAATRGAVTGSVDLSGGLAAGETLTITDKSTGQVAVIELTAGMDTDDIVAAINSEMSRKYTATVTEASGHNKVGGGAISASTTWENVDTTGSGTNDILDEETISWTTTTRTGQTVTGSYSIMDKTTDTVGDMLESIEDSFGGNVTATIDSSGRVVITDNSTGDSQIALDLTYNGAGSMSFGSMDTTTTGRFDLNITAINDGGALKIQHDTYGSVQGFTIAQTANNLGITDQEYAGLDVEGTINGETATGSGQILRGNSDSNDVAGLELRYSGSTTGVVGSLSLNLGFAELLERSVYSYSDSFEGIIAGKTDSIDVGVDSLNGQIEQMEARLELKRNRMVNQFLAMEKTISALQSQGDWLSQQVAAL